MRRRLDTLVCAREPMALLRMAFERVRMLEAARAQVRHGPPLRLAYFVFAAFESACTALFESCDEFMNFVTTSVMAPAVASP